MVILVDDGNSTSTLNTLMTDQCLKTRLDSISIFFLIQKPFIFPLCLCYHAAI